MAGALSAAVRGRYHSTDPSTPANSASPSSRSTTPKPAAPTPTTPRADLQPHPLARHRSHSARRRPGRLSITPPLRQDCRRERTVGRHRPGRHVADLPGMRRERPATRSDGGAVDARKPELLHLRRTDLTGFRKLPRAFPQGQPSQHRHARPDRRSRSHERPLLRHQRISRHEDPLRTPRHRPTPDAQQLHPPPPRTNGRRRPRRPQRRHPRRERLRSTTNSATTPTTTSPPPSCTNSTIPPSTHRHSNCPPTAPPQPQPHHRRPRVRPAIEQLHDLGLAMRKPDRSTPTTPKAPTPCRPQTSPPSSGW